MAVPQKFTAKTASIPAPIGGWNARDSLAQMAPTDAVQLVNFFPTPTDVTLRSGYSKYSTGISGEVDSLMNYAGTTSQTLFAAAGTKIYNCNTSTATEAFTGTTNAKFQHVNFSNAAGNFLVACNGTDASDRLIIGNLTYYSLLHPLGISGYGGIPYYFYPYT